MASWPSTLPQSIPENGFGQSLDDNVIRSPMGYGPAKTRRRTTGTIEGFTFILVLTDAQKDTLRTFYRTTLVDGSVSFTWVDHLNSRASSTCRFLSPITWSKQNGYWFAACSIEIL